VSISFPSVGKNLENVWKKCFLLQNEFFLKKVAEKLAYVKKKQYLCSGFQRVEIVSKPGQNRVTIFRLGRKTEVKTCQKPT